jgi:hypothetical protein
METYRKPDTEEEVTVVESIGVLQPVEFRRGFSEKFEPQFQHEGTSFSNEYAIPEWLADNVWVEMGIDPEEHGIRVVNTDEWNKM